MYRFVILAAPRTGSNLLCTLLQSHPDVLCHHEVFNPDGIFTALPLRDTDFSLGSIAERETDPLDFLERIWENALGHQHVGFKMTHGQKMQILDAVCTDTSIHKIILKREGRLKTHVSFLLAERSGIWEDYRDIETVTPPQSIEVDYVKLKASIGFNDEYYAYLETKICGPKTDLSYETLFQTEIQQRLLKELNLKAHPLQASSRQQNPQPLMGLICNSDRLAEELSRYPNDAQLLQELNDT